MTLQDSGLLPVADGILTLGPTDFGALFQDTLMRVTDGAPIVVHGAERSTDGNVVTVVGTTALLNAVNVAATVTAQPGANGPTITARFAPPATAPYIWHFSNSFPNLPPFNAGARSDDGGAGLLDRLPIAGGAFTINTLSGAADPVTGAPLAMGLGFAASLAPMQLLGLVGTLLPPDTLQLPVSGPVLLPLAGQKVPALPDQPLPELPWQASWPVPGIMLSSPIGGTTLGTALRIDGVGLNIYSPTDAAWMAANPSYAPVAAGTAKITIPSASISADINLLGVLAPGQMTLTGVFEGVTFQKLEDLIDAAGGSDLAGFLPSDVQQKLSSTLGQLSLEAVSVTVGQSMRVGAISIAVGIPHLDTQVLPGFTIDSLVSSFTMVDPFGANRGVSVTIGGDVTVFDAPFHIDLDLTSGAATAALAGPIAINLAAVAARADLSLPADIPALSVDTMEFAADTSGGIGFRIGLAADPNPWTIDLGPVPLTISDVEASIVKPAAGSASGSFGGRIAIGGGSLAFSYQTPGDFLFQGGIDEVGLVTLARQLTGSSLSFIPDGFEITLTNSVAMIQKSGEDLRLSLVTTVDETGIVGLDVNRSSGSWGFAFGLDLQHPDLSALPGLSGLSTLQSIFSLSELQLVVASYDDAAFQFLPASSFPSPSVPAGSGVQLGAVGGIIAGLNVHGTWTLNTGADDQKLLQDLLGLEPMLDIVLQIGVNPAQNSALAVHVATSLCGMPIAGAFGGRVSNGDVSLFLDATMVTQIGGETQTWLVTLAVFPNGVLFSGGMRGTITFDGITLANLALVIGCDWEGIPSFGIAGAMTVGGFNSSLAVFFNSEDPAQSLLAGSVSDLTLADVADTFAGGDVPPELAALLGQIGLAGTAAFTIPSSVGTALDTLDLATVSKAFGAAGVTLPTSSQQVLVTRGGTDASGNGVKWFVTNLAYEMRHYSAVAGPNGIVVTLDPQLYLAPAAVKLAGVQYDQGFFVAATLKILTFTASVEISIDKANGIAVDGSMSRVVIGTAALFSLTNADGTAGPDISIATYTQPQLPAPLQPPHAIIDAGLTMLGIRRDVYVSISKDGFTFLIDGGVGSVVTYSLAGSFTGLTALAVKGSVFLGFDSIDLGALGAIHLGLQVSASADIGVSGSAMWAHFGLNLSILGKTFNPTLSLDVTAGQIAGLADMAVAELETLLLAFFADAKTWALAVWQGLIKGIEDLESALIKLFGLSSAEAAAIMATLQAIGGCAIGSALLAA
ncbi:hypothetical protein [Sphingomonas sp. Leaf242]|uniref:hypothetical protein n=1 Tax=Sphingomonas sp. Leaf242 TaxID=1736304 RepID=UPI000715A041|nr:hypothetical protein [Sphingomonas sp. Leaf242]KQO12473.1 hypothetical protein ASF09_19005 [Sphingomonas sp. Leaf242]